MDWPTICPVCRIMWYNSFRCRWKTNSICRKWMRVQCACGDDGLVCETASFQIGSIPSILRNYNDNLHSHDIRNFYKKLLKPGCSVSFNSSLRLIDKEQCPKQRQSTKTQYIATWIQYIALLREKRKKVLCYMSLHPKQVENRIAFCTRKLIRSLAAVQRQSGVPVVEPGLVYTQFTFDLPYALAHVQRRRVNYTARVSMLCVRACVCESVHVCMCASCTTIHSSIQSDVVCECWLVGGNKISPPFGCRLLSFAALLLLPSLLTAAEQPNDCVHDTRTSLEAIFLVANQFESTISRLNIVAQWERERVDRRRSRCRQHWVFFFYFVVWNSTTATLGSDSSSSEVRTQPKKLFDISWKPHCWW